jgi:hypothetical protein
MTTPTAQVLGIQAESEQAERDRQAVAVMAEAAANAPSLHDKDAYREALFLVAHPETTVSTDADHGWWTPAMGCVSKPKGGAR